MKRCKNPNCPRPGRKFEPQYNTLQPCCSPACAIEWAKTEKGQEFERKQRRQESLEAKRNFRENNLSWWLAVQAAESNKNGGNTAYWLHRYIRLVRDRGLPCIMCGKPINGIAHACHFRSRGAAPQLRFHPDNIHSGHAHCNTYTTGDTAANYRANLVDRIGEDRVIALEVNNEPHKWTIDECRELRDHYRDLCKQAEAA